MSSTTDKIKGLANEAAGNVKQGLGKVTGNDRLVAEGKAQALERLGAAVVHRGWPEAGAWADLVTRGLALDPDVVRRLAQPDALTRTAAAIEALCRDADCTPPEREP